MNRMAIYSMRYNKVKYLSALILVLFTCHELYATPCISDDINEYRKWIHPAYQYHLKFGLAFLNGLTIFYFLLRERLLPMIRRLCNYLVCHRALAIICFDILISVPMGIVINAISVLINDLTLPLIGIFIIIVMNIVMQANRRFLKILFGHTQFVIILVADISAVCASLLFIILMKLDLLYLPENEFSYLWLGPYYHPIDSCKEIWEPVASYIVFIPFVLMLLWIENACNWLDKYVREKIWPILQNLKNVR